MPNPENQKKKRRTMLEGFNNVPKLLEEARQAVDEMSMGVQDQGAELTAAATRGRKTGPRQKTVLPRKTSAGQEGRQKKPSPAPVSQEKAEAPAIPPDTDTLARPLLGLGECGIRVKHAIPGRIRLRLHKMLHNDTLAEELPALLAAVPGVTAVEASTATGSLLITFNPGDMAAVKARQKLDGVMHRFFPRLDTESLVRRMLGE